MIFFFNWRTSPFGFIQFVRHAPIVYSVLEWLHATYCNGTVVCTYASRISQELFIFSASHSAGVSLRAQGSTVSNLAQFGHAQPPNKL